jgi:hypothetical protein
MSGLRHAAIVGGGGAGGYRGNGKGSAMGGGGGGRPWFVMGRIIMEGQNGRRRSGRRWPVDFDGRREPREEEDEATADGCGSVC